MKRIAMWSGPRNISTAMMRSFENRVDTAVVDEPFYACYLKRSGLIHPMNDRILESQPTTEEPVIDMLTRGEPEGVDIFYQKLMCHHMIEDMDTSWLRDVTNVFLIRDPRAMVASYANAMEVVTVERLGMRQMNNFFERESDRLGKAPIVIESADVLKNPQNALKKLCLSLDIPFDDAMLSWPAGKRDSDGIWAPHWYKSVEKSTGFMPYQKKETILSTSLESVVDECMPVYEKLLQFKL